MGSGSNADVPAEGQWCDLNSAGVSLGTEGVARTGFKKRQRQLVILKFYSQLRGRFFCLLGGLVYSQTIPSHHGAGEDTASQSGDKFSRVFPFMVRLRVKTFLPTL